MLCISISPGCIAHNSPPTLSSSDFIQALEARDLERLRNIPKTDLHNHGSLGFPIEVLRARTPDPIPDAPYLMPTFQDFLEYLKILQPHLYTHDGFIASIRDTLAMAAQDSVTELEISIDCQVVPEFDSVDDIVTVLKTLFDAVPQVKVRPEVGINREWDAQRLEAWVMPLIDTGFFAAIDLYGNELFGEPEEFVQCYDLARGKGMRLKAHAGEYRDATFVRHSVEVLELDEVQHGIAAVQSQEVMRWLADNEIRLNVCPTSNLRLARIPSIAEHPLRQLADAGIPVTINTDDLLVFGQSVSDEYLNLFNAGVFSAQELDEIRAGSFRD